MRLRASLLLATIFIGSGLQAESQFTTHVRHILVSDQRIADVILPGEAELVVESRRSRPLEVAPPAGVSAIDWLVRGSDLAFIMFVNDVNSRLTDNQTWITSQVSGSVLEVVKGSPVRPLQVGDHVGFEQDGGEITLVSTKVIARVRWATPVQSYRRYLVFSSVDDSTKELIFDNSTMFDLTSGRLRSLVHGRFLTDEFNGASEDEILTRIRRLSGHP
jgi:hypothetical protein